MQDILKVIQLDQRKISDRRKAPYGDSNNYKGKENRFHSERRTTPFLNENQLNKYLDHLHWRMTELTNWISDKEKKKLAIAGGSITALTLLVTISGFLVAGNEGITSQKISSSSIYLLLVSLCAIAFLNMAVIKYLLALKIDILLAMRQNNCLRQAIHEAIYAMVQTHWPLQLPKQKSEPKSTTVLDETSAFWNVYGRHEKFLLTNDRLRSHYEMKMLPLIPFLSADFFAVMAIGCVTIAILASPFFFYDPSMLNGTVDSSTALMSGIFLGIAISIFFIFWIMNAGYTLYEIGNTLKSEK